MRLKDGLLAPVRLSERAVAALEELGPMHRELVRMREQTASMPDLLPELQRVSEALAPLEERLVGLEHAMAGIVGRIGEIQDTLNVLKEDVEHVPGIPAGDETRSLLDRARDALGANEPDTP